MGSGGLIRAGDAELQSVLADALGHASRGRERLFLYAIVKRVFAYAATVQQSHRLLRFAYSVKTNPRAEILQTARDAGIAAEVISPAELRHALDCGFDAGSIVYNGPYPATYAQTAPGIVLADSLEAFAAAAAAFSGTTIGLRIRPAGISSRFGIPSTQLQRMAEAVRACGRREIGISFHVRPQDYEGKDWRTLVASVVSTAQALERATGARVMVFDVGGGKRPDELDRAIDSGEFEWLEKHVESALPHVASIVCEPGQALAEPAEAMAAPVLEVRNPGAAPDIVIDAGYPDFPQIATFEHRLFMQRTGALSPIPANGTGRILGRTCLEYDTITDRALLSDVAVGDAIVVADAGAYDASMSFVFSQGAAGNSAEHGLARR